MLNNRKVRRSIELLQVCLAVFIFSVLFFGCGPEVAVVESLSKGVAKKIEARLHEVGEELHGKIQVKKVENERYDIFIPIKDKLYKKAYFDDYKKRRSARLESIRSKYKKDIIIGGLAYGFAYADVRDVERLMGIRLVPAGKIWASKESPFVGLGAAWFPPVVDAEKINSIEVEVWKCMAEEAYVKGRDEYGNVIRYEEEPPLKIGSLKLHYNAKPEEMKWENWWRVSKQVKKRIWQKAIVKVE